MRDAISNPKPIQHPYPPIWIGASGPRTLMLTARHADVWNASGSPEELTELSTRLDELCVAIGRDPSTIRRSVQYAWDGLDRAELVDTAGGRARRGFSEHIITLPVRDAVRVASLAAEALGDLRTLGVCAAG